MLCLEGGYHTSQTTKSVEECLRSLLQDPDPSQKEDQQIHSSRGAGGEEKEGKDEDVASEIIAVVREVKQILGAHWVFN